MMSMESKVENIVERELGNLGFELVKLETSFRGRRKILRIFIDHPDRSVTIDDCVAVSKSVGFVLEGEESIPGPYNLEVSSPGINRPLTKPGHFTRFKGREARVEYIKEDGEKETSIGEIVDADDNGVTLSAGGVDKKIFFKRIVKANLHAEKWDIPKSGKKKHGLKRNR